MRDLSIVFFFKQKTAYEMRISDWSSDVCSSDLAKAGDETVPTIAKGHSVAPCDPDQHGKRRHGTDLRHGRKHILGARKSSIKERKARQDHNADEDAGTHPPPHLPPSRPRPSGPSPRTPCTPDLTRPTSAPP